MDYKNLKDENLVEYVRSKDKEAFDEIINRYETKLVRYTSYITRDVGLAEDIVQDTFVKAFINLNGFDVKKKFSSWIYRIAHNEAMNQLKRRKKQITISGYNFFENIFSKEDTPEEEYEKEEIAQNVRKGLNSLPTKYSEVMVLFYIEEKAYEEISDILRMPIGTVGTRINRGKKLLRRILEEQK